MLHNGYYCHPITGRIYRVFAEALSGGLHVIMAACSKGDIYRIIVESGEII